MMKPLKWVMAVVCGTASAGCGMLVMQEPQADPVMIPMHDAGPAVTDVMPANSSPSPGVYAEDVPDFVSMYPIVPNQGGPRLTSPQLVSVTYEADPSAAGEEALVQYLVGGTWIHDVGAEYGIGVGSVLRMVRRTTAPPAAITSQQIEAALEADVQSGALPSPPGGDYSNALYMFFFPATTQISFIYAYETAYSCVAFSGYHDAVSFSLGRISYAVIVGCEDPENGLTMDALEQVTASHEYIEAATDADPVNHPAYQLLPDEGYPYAEHGSEVGDLCLGSNIIMDGFTLQQVWSNRVAAMGTVMPCVPLTSGDD